MKKLTIITAFCALILGGCAENNLDGITPEENTVTLPDLTAGFADEKCTKTYVEEDKYLRWHEDDRITAFYGNTLNRQYKFKGATGDNSGTFSLVPSGELGTGNDLEAIYAIYPYDDNSTITDKGEISLTLPAVQTYTENSFGRGANTMIAVTENLEDTFLAFKNSCGYLKLKLYGDNVTLASIEVKGNNNEKIAGAATATIAFGGAPQLTMADEATTTITLGCGEGATLGTTAEAATEFWVVIPETTFVSGITITITDTEGSVFEKSTSNSVAITRNDIQPMAALEVEVAPVGPANNEIWYTATQKVEPYNKIVFGANYMSNEWDSETSKGVITFDGEVTKIGKRAFYFRSTFTSITIPNSVTEIGEEAFQGCSNLTSVYIPDSVTTIGKNVFAGCNSLTSITIPDGITEIRTWAFRECNSLTSVTIPNSVISIGESAFSKCSSLKTAIIGNGVTEIGREAFYECSSLTSVTIPDSITTIGPFAFHECSSLTSVYCKATTPPSLDSYVFQYYDNDIGDYRNLNCRIYVPTESVEAYKSASGWSEYQSYIVGYNF